MKSKFLAGSFNIACYLILCVVLCFIINYINLLIWPWRLLILFSLLIILGIVISFYLTRDIKKYNIAMYICFLFNAVMLYLIFGINNRYEFVSNFFNNHSYTTYNMVVLRKNVFYTDWQRLSNKNIGGISKYVNLPDLKYSYKKYNSVKELVNGIEEAEVQSIVVTNDQLDDLQKNYQKFYSKTKIVKTFQAPVI